MKEFLAGGWVGLPETIWGIRSRSEKFIEEDIDIMTTSFKQLWDVYPTEDRSQFFTNLGGGWPALISNEKYKNTCALRLSVALQRVGMNVPPELAAKDGNLRDGKGNFVIVKVTSAKALLTKYFGDYNWGTSKQIGTNLDTGLLPAWTAIMLYTVLPPADATGHVDLWNKNTCRVNCHESFARDATSVELWKLD
ncbi:T6SS effector amidase Tae4 family protein [Nitrosospira multiformis]|uniref:T6SS effector amidase Tae4 family protein n=1 Tax=Nitrosospira multiformis TaxID=1231 RepID=UPI0015E6A631|nr:T6SS effector amidase Tae4 family protein [Nitrosospira multiformis]